MTRLGMLMGLFPALHMLAIGAALVGLIRSPDLIGVSALIGVTYLAPLLLFRVHEAVFPLREGRSLLVGGGYSPWWGASRIQWLFSSFLFLEEVLRLVPGLFSLWLRAWGSKIGAGVVWTPQLLLLDRSMLEVGSYAVWGYSTGASAHIVSGKGDNLEVVVAKVRVGRGTVVGAGSKLMPGCTIGDRCVIGVDARIGAFARIGDRVRTGPMPWIDAKITVPDDTRLGSYVQLTSPPDAPP